MKKIFLLLISLSLLQSCEKDESLDPRPLLVGGQFVRLDITKSKMNFDDIDNTYFGGLLTTPANNVSKYNLYVRRLNGAVIVPVSDFKLVKVVTSFPLDLKIKPQEIAVALGLNITDLGKGDVFRFYGESFDANGNRADFYSLSSTVQTTASYKQAYRFITILTDTPGVSPSELAAYDSYPPQ